MLYIIIINQNIRIVKLGSKDPECLTTTDEEGQIIASLDGDEAFDGYWKRDDANEKSIYEGWYFTGDIGYAIQTHAEKNHYSVVKNYCGHGIGKIYHEDPQITHFGNKGEGIKLEEGMVFTIEPMINLGSHKTKLLKDGWTVVTEDGKLSAQWEHTIAITEQGYEILTLREEEK